MLRLLRTKPYLSDECVLRLLRTKPYLSDECVLRLLPTKPYRSDECVLSLLWTKPYRSDECVSRSNYLRVMSCSAVNGASVSVISRTSCSYKDARNTAGRASLQASR